MSELTSRERMLRTIALEEADHTPCCFMSFSALRKRLNYDRYAVAKAQPLRRVRGGVDAAGSRWTSTWPLGSSP